MLVAAAADAAEEEGFDNLAAGLRYGAIHKRRPYASCIGGEKAYWFSNDETDYNNTFSHLEKHVFDKLTKQCYITPVDKKYESRREAYEDLGQAVTSLLLTV